MSNVVPMMHLAMVGAVVMVEFCGSGFVAVAIIGDSDSDDEHLPVVVTRRSP